MSFRGRFRHICFSFSCNFRDTLQFPVIQKTSTTSLDKDLFKRSKMKTETQAKRLCTEKQLTIGTHNGTFHCDEVLACFMLKQLPEFQNAKILRSRDITLLKAQCDIIVDVGGEFNHELKLYDHHQKEFQETLCKLRPEFGSEFNIRLSSAGLVYAYYGERVIEAILKREKDIKLSEQNLRVTYIQIYRNFISEIDAIDNGVQMFENGEPLYKISTHLSSRIGKLNPSWMDEGNIDVLTEERFERAMAAAGAEFVNNVVEIGFSWIRARDYVRDALEQAKSVYHTGEILLLEKFCPWKAHLSDLEEEMKVKGIPKLVIFQDNTTSWRVAGVPVTPTSFLGRKFLPEKWRGLTNEDLSTVAGIPDLVFVHHTGFIAGCKSKEAALAMAIKSVEWPEIPLPNAL